MQETLTTSQHAMGLICGSVVGLSLGLTGAGGSILSVPLMVYCVGISNARLAIGTSALAVAVNAASTLIHHARNGTVLWGSASIFALSGVAGAAAGSALGKTIDASRLLAVFAVLMIVVAALMLKSRPRTDLRNPPPARNAAVLVAAGGAAGAASGFFGIGGGFLVVPSLIFATGMPTLQAVGSSLVAITAFALTTALSYATSGWVDWMLACMFSIGGVGGGFVGARLAQRLSLEKGALNTLFAALLVLIALRILWDSAHAA